MLEASFDESDLRVPPSNRFEHLKGNLKGFCNIRINEQFRIIFRFENSNAYDVYIDDYHK
jgi:proteic killer suppression protein